MHHERRGDDGPVGELELRPEAVGAGPVEPHVQVEVGTERACRAGPKTGRPWPSKVSACRWRERRAVGAHHDHVAGGAEVGLQVVDRAGAGRRRR